MSTPTLIATINADGTTYTGVNCHFDGYPTGVLAHLRDVISRDGAGPAMTAVLAHNWESLTVRTAPEDNPENVVPGYGRAFAGSHAHHGDLHDGHLDMSASPMAWAYLLSADLSTVSVYEWKNSVPVAVISVGDLPKTDLTAIECGDNYERCEHYAWAHDETVPEGSRNMGMRHWLGLEPMSIDNAIGVTTVNGVRYTMGRSGRLRGSKWEAYVSLNGHQTYLPVFAQKRGNQRTGLPGLTFDYPATKATLASV